MDNTAEVLQWLDANLGHRAKTINSEDILGSLGYAGDDANEFIVEFATHFDVDVSAFDPWQHYDADEPPFFGRYRPYSVDGKVLPSLPISVSDLATAAAAGKWMKDYSGRELHIHPLKRMLILTVATLIAIVATVVILSAVL